MPELCRGTVISNRKLTNAACMLTVDAGSLAACALPGQFVHIRCGEGSLLRRPISICDARDGKLTLVVEARGTGTEWLCGRAAGDVLDILGPLGSGFEVSAQHIVLLGGGVGVPPLFYAARQAAGNKTAILGFRNRGAVILTEEFKSVCNAVHITTEDGSAGEQGLVTGPLGRLLEQGGVDAVLACGPRPMLRAVAEASAAKGVPCQVSLEERMGCGIGACLVCACRTIRDGKEFMRHVCKDGPVFDAGEVVW